MDIADLDRSRIAILYVGNDPHLTPRFVDAVRQRGYTVEIAADGLAARARLGAGSVALLITGMWPEGTAGVELFKAARRSPGQQDLPVLFITPARFELPEETGLALAQEFGPYDVFVTPCPFHRLADAVDELVAAGRVRAR